MKYMAQKRTAVSPPLKLYFSIFSYDLLHTMN